MYEICIYDFATNTAQKMKFSIKDFFSKCDQIRNTNTTNIIVRRAGRPDVIFLTYSKPLRKKCSENMQLKYQC